MVYVVEAVGSNRIKIGHTESRNVKTRVSGLKTGCPFPLEVLATMPGGPSQEYQLHSQFSEYRAVGEWFLLASPVVSWLEELRRWDRAKLTPYWHKRFGDVVCSCEYCVKDTGVYLYRGQGCL